MWYDKKNDLYISALTAKLQYYAFICDFYLYKCPQILTIDSERAERDGAISLRIGKAVSRRNLRAPELTDFYFDTLENPKTFLFDRHARSSSSFPFTIRLFLSLSLCIPTRTVTHRTVQDAANVKLKRDRFSRGNGLEKASLVLIGWQRGRVIE